MSLLKQGNEAYRAKKYKEALEYYIKAQTELPALSKVLKFNIDQIERKLGETLVLPVLNPIKKLPITALVITWDVGHNPLGRSYMLAESLENAVKNVVICGFQFSRYGNDIWQPVREGRLPVIALPGGNMAEWLAVCEKAVEKFKPDVVIACKPRLPSVELGIMFKQKYNIPLIIDVDDNELSFFNDAEPLTIDQFKKLDIEEIKKANEPYCEIWTRLTETLTKKFADEIITSNVALDKKFGGTIIPHVRNEMTFDNQRYNKAQQRKKYGISTNAKIVMFFGTPRVHKGIDSIAEAIGKIKDTNIRLVVVGEATDKSVTQQLSKLSKDKVFYLPNQPFSAIPEIIVMADLVILPQDINHPISKYQLPAKAIDAIAMNIPLYVSGTEPLMQLVNDKVAKLLPEDNLENVIEQTLNANTTNIDLIEVRKKFLLNYSYHAAALKLKIIIERAQKNKRRTLVGFSELRTLQKELFPTIQKTSKNDGIDIVVFWKQNDTGLYGRRSDMVIKYLASRDDIRKVIVFDAPISQFDIESLKNGQPLTQSRDVYIKVYEKMLGKLDKQKVSFNVFAYPSGIYTAKEDGQNGRAPLIEGYSNYLKEVFERENVNPEDSIFWFYPKINMAEKIIDNFKPKKVVVDVVDDHRAWPNIAEKQKNELTEHYRNLLARADIAFANCKPVIDSMKEFKHDIHLIPNGCEENPEINAPKNHPLYEELKNYKGNIIGFVGNLEAKIDVELIEKVADKFPDALIVLIGSTHANPSILKLRQYSNIRMPGVITYNEIGAFVSLFNVGMIPHLNLEMTRSMNPLKQYVYLSCRVPVVSTEVYNIDSSLSFIRVARSHDEFIQNIDIMFGMNKVGKEALQRYITANCWAERLRFHVDKLLEFSNQC